MMSRDTMVIVAIALCVFATIYLLKEMKDMKAIINKPPQIMRIPYPVQMEEPSVPVPVTKKVAKVAKAVKVVEEKEESEEESEE